MVSTSVSRSEEEGEESAEGEVGIMSASRSIISPAPPAPAEAWPGVGKARGVVVVDATGGGRSGVISIRTLTQDAWLGARLENALS